MTQIQQTPVRCLELDIIADRSRADQDDYHKLEHFHWTAMARRIADHQENQNIECGEEDRSP